MPYQRFFKRYELKYLLSRDQKERILRAMEPWMALDGYGRTTIRSLYFDTGDYRLIRRSMEKPAYKEKLRVRSYQKAAPDSPVFLELKKKYGGVVYKRRLSLPEQDAMAWVTGERPCRENSQIAREIDYFLRYYQHLRPAALLCYEREAYFCKDGSDFRVTFDDNIRCRREALSLGAETWGTPILEPDRVLMELKCAGGIPLWMVRALSREGIYQTSFSKYAAAYRLLVFPEIKGGIVNA